MILQPIYSRFGIQIATQFSFYSPVERIWQFTAGGLGFLILDKFQSHVKNCSSKWKIAFIILLVVILFSKMPIDIKIGSIIASTTAVILIANRSLDVLPNFLKQKLVWLGYRSYSIYLVHMPLLYIAKYSALTQINQDKYGIFQSATGVVASILLGALCYSKIEKKFRDTNKGQIAELKTISSTLVLTFVLPLVFLVSVVLSYKNQYWGLDRTISQPVAAWSIDPKCNRMSYRGHPCFYREKNATHTVLLIGDSHAGHISQAVVDAAIKEKWNAAVWTQAGCLVQFRRSQINSITDECLNQNNEILKWVKNYKPDQIIVSQFVHSNSSQRDLRNALSDLESVVPNILLIKNNPIFPDGQDFMVKRPLLMSPYVPPKSFLRLDMQMKDQGYSDELAKWAKNNRISTLDLTYLFCKKDICTRKTNGGWLYLDDNHFSILGATLVVPLIRKSLKSLSKVNVPQISAQMQQLSD